MSVSYEIDAQPRDDKGKGASRRLRRAGLVPGVIYGARKDPEMISLQHNELLRRLGNEAFYSHILDVHLGGETQKVVLKDLQRHPSKPFVIHVDLQRVSFSEKLKVNVPLHFVGEELAPGVKKGGIVAHALTDVEVSCLPGNLPEFIEVDASQLELGDSLHLSDLILPEGVEIPSLAAGNNDLILSIQTQKAETEEVEGEGEEEEEGAVPSPESED